MTGLADPFCRRPYPWGNEDGELIAHYRLITGIRSENPVFTEGKTSFASPARDIFVIARVLDGREALTLVNRGASRSIALTPDDFAEGEDRPSFVGEYVNTVSGRHAEFDGRLTVTVPANGFVILLSNR